MNSIAMGYKLTFCVFDGDHVSHSSEKRLFIIAQKYLFPKLERLPLVMVGEVGDRLRVYLSSVPPTATALLEILILENYHDEEIERGRKLMGSIKRIQRLQLRLWVHCFSRCQYYDMYIMIYSSILKGSHSELVVVLQLLLMSSFCDLQGFINDNC